MDLAGTHLQDGTDGFPSKISHTQCKLLKKNMGRERELKLLGSVGT